MKREQLCFSTLGCVEKTVEEVTSLAVRNGIGSLEVRGLAGELDTGKIEAFSEENAAVTLALWRQNGVMPRVLGTSCVFHDAGKLEASLKEGREALAVARRMGFGAIRVFGNKLCRGETLEMTAERVSRGILALCDVAAGTGVRVLLEVHGDFNRRETLFPVLDRCGGHASFGLIWDVAHSDRAYGADWQAFYRDIRPFIRHVHLKDHVRTSDGTPPRLVLPGEGDIPLSDILAALERDGFTGGYSLEWEAKWHPELPPLSAALERYCAIVAPYL